MGWTDLFKSKSSSSKPDPRLRWFGKLPTYADYYVSQGNENWALEFNDWLIKGYELYHSRNKSADLANRMMPIGGYAIRLPKSGMTVVGSVQDYGGDMRGRPFPLCFYVGVPTARWPGPDGAHVTPAARLVRDLLALRDDVVRFFKSPGRFDAEFGERQLDLTGLDGEQADDSWADAARRCRMSDWHGGAGLKVADVDEWRRLAEEWGERIAAHDGKEFEPTLRLPLSSKAPIDAQLGGWLKWLEARMKLSQRYLSLIVSGELEAGEARLTVVARDILPEDFLLLTPLAGTLNYVDDLSSAASESSGAGAAAAGGDGSFATRSWYDFATAQRGK